MKSKIVNIIIIFLLSMIILIDVVQALSMNIGMDYFINDDEIRVKVKINNLKIDENKINSISVKLSYDDKVLEYKSVANLNGWTAQYSNETNKLTLIKLSGTNEDEQICEINFGIKNKSKLNNTEIILINGAVSDGESEVELSNSSLKIVLTNSSNNENKNINVNTNTNINQNKNNDINQNKNIINNLNTNKNININQNKNNESKIQINNKSDNTITSNKIPYAGIKTYIRIAILIILTVATLVYIKYKKIDKIC